ncbi:hypothetical protein Dimus_004711 [Dionaea muscipula]
MRIHQRRKAVASAMAILLFLMEVFATTVGLTTTADCRQQVLSPRDVPWRQLLQKRGVESKDFMINHIEKEEELRPLTRRRLRSGPVIGPPSPDADHRSHGHRLKNK